MKAWARPLVVLGLVAGTLFASASPAAAHAALIETTPAAAQLLDAEPSQVTLLFTERVGTKLGASKVFDPSGRRVDTGRVSTRQDGREVVVPLQGATAQGTYVVQWRVLSEDAHPVAGSFVFSVGQESEPGATAGSSAPAGPRAVLGAARLLGFLGLLGLGGAALFCAFLWPAGVLARRLRVALWVCWSALALGGAAALLAQGPYASGQGVAAMADGALLREVLETTQGRALAARLALLLAAAPALVALGRWGARAPRRPPSLLLLAAATGPLAVTFALAGHANSGELRSVATAVDAVHLVAVATWVGGLLALLLLLHRIDLASVMSRWSKLATGAVVVMVVTGSFASWREVRSLDALLATDYGRMLIAKASLVAMMLVAAWGARDLVRRRWSRTTLLAATDLEAEQRAATRMLADRRFLRRSVLLEAGLGVIVIALTSVLVQTTPARTAYAPTYSGTSTAEALGVQVDVEPAKQGVANVMHVYLQDATGKAVDVEEVRGRLVQGEQVVPVELPRKSLGHYEQTRVLVDVGGEWRLELVIRTTEIDSSTTVQTIPFR